ncbi:MAG: hypothetical protein IT331_20045 [Anaerolineae bacterium]|nr:hypothetical protein [Anaerolineae bacterium]
MNYQDYEYGAGTENPGWTPALSSQMVSARSDAQLYPLSPNPVIPQPAQPALSEMLMIGSLLRSMQQTQNQQMFWLRDVDTRINRIEVNTRPPVAVATPSFERATWWAIWGLLMLVLGGALTVVIMLILLNIQFK